MRLLFGVANHNIFQVGSLLRQHYSDSPDLKPTMCGFQQEPSSKIVLIPTISQLLTNLPMLERADCVVFVFDAPVLLEYLTPIELIDVIPNKVNSFTYRYKAIHLGDIVDRIDGALRSKKHITIEQATLDVIPRLLGETKSSVLAPILNFLYSVSDTDRRLSYQSIIYAWFSTSQSTEELETHLYSVSKRKKRSGAIDKLIAYLDSEAGLIARAAVADINELRKAKKVVNYKSLSTRHNIAEFDLKYLVKAMRKATSIQDSIAGTTLDDIFKSRKKG